MKQSSPVLQRGSWLVVHPLNLVRRRSHQKTKCSPPFFSSTSLLGALTSPGVLWFWDQCPSLSADLRSASISLSSNHSRSISLSQVTRPAHTCKQDAQVAQSSGEVCMWLDTRWADGGRGAAPRGPIKKKHKGCLKTSGINPRLQRRFDPSTGSPNWFLPSDCLTEQSRLRTKRSNIHFRHTTKILLII